MKVWTDIDGRRFLEVGHEDCVGSMTTVIRADAVMGIAYHSGTCVVHLENGADLRIKVSLDDLMLALGLADA